MNAHAQQARSDVRKDAWLHVPLWMVRDVHAVKKALTIPNGAYFAHQYHPAPKKGGNTPSHFYCYIENGEYIQIPRNALGDLEKDWFTEPLEHIAQASLPRRAPYTNAPWLRHHIQLRPRQVAASSALATVPGDKLLSLACGVGKTVVALHALMEQRNKRLPALVVVHTKDLMEQWIARIREFWCMGLAMPGIVQGTTCTWQKAPITIAMLQTLASKQMPEAFYKHFSTVVYDEFHRLGAPVFMKTAPMFIGERWGLSATSTRPDGNERAFMLHCGPVAYEDLHQDLTPKAFFVRTPLYWDMSEFYINGDVNFAKLATSLSQDTTRNSMVLAYVKRMVRAKRVVLVLGERVEQLQGLARQVPESRPLVGPMKVKERRAALKHQVVFATSKLAKEGLDRPEFDCLVVLNPTTDNNWLQQAIGRIQRAVPGKPTPIIVFFEDHGVPPMASRCNKIRRWLAEHRIPFSFIREDA
jgi:superfamily II DNA or RNA helicase